MALFVSDYIELVKQVRNIAVRHFKDEEGKNAFQGDLDKFLAQMPARSTQRTGEKRKYKDLIKGRFELTNVVRIERQDDVNSISSKFADFTCDTIDKLIEEGENDAWKALA